MLLKRLLRTSSLIVHLPVTIHGSMVGAVLIPDLVDEVLLPEDLIEVLLLPSICIVQSLLQSLVPIVVRRYIVLIPLIRLLLELLEDGLVIITEGVVRCNETRIIQIVLSVFLLDITKDSLSPRSNLIHDLDAKFGLASICDVI